MYKIGLKAINKAWGGFSVNFVHFKENIIFKSHLMKSNSRVLGKNKVDIYRASVFTPDYSYMNDKMFVIMNNNHATD